MTERWQREVRKLGTVEPERDAWKRAATRAPSGDGLPPPRQRVVAGVVAFGGFFAAASFGWLALRPTAERTPGEVTAGTEALVTLRVGTEGSDTFPVATLKVDGVIYEGQAAPDNVWDLEGTPIPWLEEEPPFRSRDHVTIELPATLELAGDADGADAILHDPKSTFWAGAEGDQIGPLGSPLPLEPPPGRYVLEVLGYWKDHGDPSFYFPIELVEPAADGALTTLAGTEWRLTAIDGAPIDENVDRLAGASIEFKENLFGGWSGCNSFGGKYQVDGSSFSVDGIGGTQVGPCSGEQAWFDRLESADSWTSDGSTLTVSGSAGAFTAVRVGTEPVDVLRVECLPGSTHVLDRQVVATADGVAGIFGPAGHAERVEFVPVAASAGNEAMVSLGDEVTAATVPLTSGDWQVRCAGWGDEFGSADITVMPDASRSISTSPTAPTASQAASDTLHVSCTDGGAVVSTPLVAVQADGVHVVVDEAGGFGELVLDPLDDFPLQFSSGSSGVEGEFARELVPGRWRAGCVVGPEQDRSSVVGWAEFDVVDPHSLWVSTALACGGGEPIDSVENGGTITKVDDETPQEAIARVLALPASDLVEEAGYEGSFRQAYRIVREGEVVAWLLFSDWTPEWWRLTAGWACPGEGFSTEAGG